MRARLNKCCACLCLTIGLTAAGQSQALKPIPKKDLAMTCAFDQWRLLPGGVIQYTYMRCRDQAGEVSQWMRVPDHATSNPIPVESVVGPTEVEHEAQPILIPEVKPLPPPDVEDDEASNPR
jgi:hypothetical protein